MVTPDALCRAFGALVADLLAPPACAACDARLHRRAVLCASCASAVVPAGPADDHLLLAEGTAEIAHPQSLTIAAFALFGGPVAIALRRLKFDDRPDLAGPLGQLLVRAARDARLRADVVVPVPLHPARLAQRGYNQAALLAAPVARALRVPLAARALRRTRHTQQQARLDRGRRLENVVGAFAARAAGTSVRGRRVMLVDDVATTGATLASCAAALREAGALAVTALVVARTARGGEEE